MEIWINQAKIDFVLEKEKNLCDLVESLKQFSLENNLLIYDLKKDDSTIINFHNHEALKTILLSETKKVEVEMLSQVAYTVHVLKDSLSYLDGFLVQSFKDLKSKSDKLERYLNYFKQALNYSEKILNLEKNFLVLKKVLKDLEIEFFLLKNEKKKFKEQKLTNYVHSMKDLIKASFFNFNIIILKSTFAAPDQPLKHKLTNFKIFLNQLEEILVACSSDFQKNQTAAGLKKFLEIISALELILAFINFLEKNPDLKPEGKNKEFQALKKHSTEIRKLIDSLKAALENKDFVELSDVLEYEIKEIILELGEQFNSWVR